MGLCWPLLENWQAMGPRFWWDFFVKSTNYLPLVVWYGRTDSELWLGTEQNWSGMSVCFITWGSLCPALSLTDSPQRCLFSKIFLLSVVYPCASLQRPLMLPRPWCWTDAPKIYWQNEWANEWISEWGITSNPSLCANFKIIPSGLLPNLVCVSQIVKRDEAEKEAVVWLTLHEGAERWQLLGKWKECGVIGYFNISENCRWADMMGQKHEGDQGDQGE